MTNNRYSKYKERRSVKTPGLSQTENGGIIMWWRKPDRVDRNEDDKQVFYGYDDGEGETAWYTTDGTLDSITDTPYDDDDE